MDEAEWIAAFTRTAMSLYPDDPATVSLVVTMERARITSGVIIDEPEVFFLPTPISPGFAPAEPRESKFR